MIDDEILQDFIKETKTLVSELSDILDEAESGIAQAKKLETYGQVVDRINGGARTLALNMPGESLIKKIGDYALMCKTLGYRASQIKDNAEFYNVCVSLLMDATDVLSELVNLVDKKQNINLKEVISQTLIDRVKWVTEKFTNEAGSVGGAARKSSPRLTQDEIDSLISKLGL